jgi:hypothetical protein
MDFLRSTLNWENPDDDVDQCVNFEEKVKAARVNVYCTLSVPENRLFDSMLQLSFGLLLPIEKTSLLRC